ncbi:tRNA synthetases class I (M)-domain-containing protein [Xylariomycetidae sp. FL0641]|nr:tRNA synthetases class I (M)-domain-containing protein [Xylariomycetidae sp. FL0641]
MRGLLTRPCRPLSTLRTGAALRNGWICRSCRAGFSSSPARRQSQENGKPYYVTTPIFYVNASPHVGHLYSMLVADVLKRWQTLKGRTAYLSTGTDEHGMKVQQAAERQEVAPKALCDANSQTFRDLARQANIAHDAFIRTTDPEHRDAVDYFWDRLRDSGYIYETKHEGWYCVSDETFYPENMVEKAVSPHTGEVIMVATETGNAVEWTEEKNYHFRLTAFRDRLLQFYQDNPDWVTPNKRFLEVIDWVQNHLEDLSVSRPVSRLDWGIPVPDDPSQTIYVWIDALVNYLTVAGYPVWPPGAGHEKGWPADVHVVGKDIIRFHCVYWPALLMAVGLPLPQRVISHGHWMMSNQKMSKSVGNVVNPFFALDRWGVDTMRFFLVHAGRRHKDPNYSNDLIVAEYKKALQGGLGNLLNRVTRSKNWNPRAIIQEMISREQPFAQQGAEDIDIRNQMAALCELAPTVEEAMKALDPGAALNHILSSVFEANAYIARAEPWAMAKKGAVETVNQTVFLAMEMLRIQGILLQPFVPTKAAELLDRLGVAPENRTFAHAQMYVDPDYGTSRIPLGTGAGSSLFPPLPVED